ncbi:Histidine kinase, dimerization and phosphoacceptor region [metagenome]|uniref:histidine kinase n=1 Tax=metagenome TaxID=256318 RepID=A0A2P2C6I6_9ZZZZ
MPTPSDAYQPRLGWWSHAWRLIACLAVSAVVWSQAWQGQWQDARALFWLDAAGGVLAFVLVMFRRRWPLAIAAATAALSLVSGAAAGPGTLAAVSLATRRRYLPMLLAGVIGVVASQGYSDTQPLNSQDPVWFSLLINVIVTAAILGWGMYIGSRRELLWTLRDRAERAEAEQQLRVANARNAERGRIAREMHDVLAHRISQVSMHAGALAFREDLTPAEVRSSAAVIQAKANEALTDLRAVLGVLRAPETGELVDAPQPTYDDVPALISEARESGMSVEFDDQLRHGDSVPVAVGRTVYRIIQEGLTNSRKHAPGALIRVQLSGSPADGIELKLRNGVGFHTVPAAPGAGLGLIGLAERAQLRGGRLAHRVEGSTFVLHGWIPWTA